MNSKRGLSLCGVAVISLMGVVAPATAAVSADEAAKLKTELMPLGGERAGNKEGTIPAWEGGFTTVQKDFRVDPFKDDKVVVSITAQNMAQYESKLSEGVKAVMRKYPDSFRVDVYPTRRTAAAPQWVYDNTFKNATRAKLVDTVLDGAYGGLPFPIPKTGEEVIWNHLVRWRGQATRQNAVQYQITASGQKVKISDIQIDYQYPYYFQDVTPEKFYASGGAYFNGRLLTSAPAIRAGDAFTGHVNVDPARDEAWLYLTGQRRVRKLPNVCCDTPNPNIGGVGSFDETEAFTGRIDRFDWKLLGKKEIYVPYNNLRMYTAKSDADVLGDRHVKPEFMRWELHRMWVIEAALKAGQRHAAVRSRYYCDEDSGHCLLGERWDSKGQLWKMTWGATVPVGELPGLMMPQFGMIDLLAGTAFVAGLNSAGGPAPIEVKKRWPETYFSSDALAGEGVR